MAPQIQYESTVTTAFRLPKSTFDRLCQRLPRKGDRTRLYTNLIDQFLKGELTVTIKL